MIWRRNHGAAWRRAAGGSIPVAVLLGGASGMGTRAQQTGPDLRLAARMVRRGEPAYRLSIRIFPGPNDVRPIVCVHGLTRNGGDFERLGNRLSAQRTVIALDVVGRGASDWLGDPAGYNYPRYVQDAAAALAALGVTECDWLGTSMGGIIGMLIASGEDSPVRRLIINDVGPFIPADALRRIGAYVGRDDRFRSIGDVEARLRDVHAPFGRLESADWRRMAWNSALSTPDGGYRLAYDPSIAAPFADPKTIEDVDLWSIWDRIRQPTLVIRGEASDLLSEQTLHEMTRRGPGRLDRVSTVVFEGIGHAPALMDRRQIDGVARWLAG